MDDMGHLFRSTIEHFTYLDPWRSLKHLEKRGKVAPLGPPGNVTLLLSEAFPPWIKVKCAGFCGS